jgi:hypothetical protein
MTYFNHLFECLGVTRTALTPYGVARGNFTTSGSLGVTPMLFHTTHWKTKPFGSIKFSISAPNDWKRLPETFQSFVTNVFILILETVWDKRFYSLAVPVFNSCSKNFAYICLKCSSWFWLSFLFFSARLQRATLASQSARKITEIWIQHNEQWRAKEFEQTQFSPKLIMSTIEKFDHNYRPNCS